MLSLALLAKIMYIFTLFPQACYMLCSGAAFEGGKWGDRPALQAYEFVKLYSPVNWKC